ncbi:MAG: bacteriohemerythrin [Candidatus Magasanikbacteria bacterium]|nr:bacteriohemerythrin [Candidatus Magasanikbacteria bacterium]
MANIVWLKKYSVGVEEFDFHHKKIFALIGQYGDLLRSQEKNKMLDKLLSELNKYIDYHLAAEEEDFKKYGYPEEKMHIKIHNGFRAKIGDLIERAGEPGIYKEVDDFLADWWINHILKIDKKYTKFFNDHGLY